ncbi:hypothetical protein Taro_028584, partial [Colocasia esculenta]|nr:hypothetical protein [Colocasia esculenta]
MKALDSFGTPPVSLSLPSSIGRAGLTAESGRPSACRTPPPPHPSVASQPSLRPRRHPPFPGATARSSCVEEHVPAGRHSIVTAPPDFFLLFLFVLRPLSPPATLSQKRSTPFRLPHFSFFLLRPSGAADPPPDPADSIRRRPPSPSSFLRSLSLSCWISLSLSPVRALCPSRIFLPLDLSLPHRRSLSSPSPSLSDSLSRPPCNYRPRELGLRTKPPGPAPSPAPPPVSRPPRPPESQPGSQQRGALDRTTQATSRLSGPVQPPACWQAQPGPFSSRPSEFNSAHQPGTSHVQFVPHHQNVLQLFQRYRRDRRVLLTFILSDNLIKKVAMPPGAVSLDDVDLDQDNAGSIQDFFLITTPESSGPAPSRVPPPLPTGRPISTSLSAPVASSLSSLPTETNLSPSPLAVNLSKSQSLHSSGHQELTIDDIEDFEDDEDEDEVNSLRNSRCQRNDASDLQLGFPPFATGMTDDDLRETAYEILVASAGAAGGLIVPSKEKKKERKSRLLKKLARSKSDNIVDQPQHAPGLAVAAGPPAGKLALVARVVAVGPGYTGQAAGLISEAMDIRTRKGLLSALVGKVGKRMDTLLIPLELLSCVSRNEFSDKKAFLRWQKRQLNILEEGLINHPVVGFGESGRKANDLRILLRKIEESESLPPSAGEVQRTECLRSLRDITMLLAERPARGDLTGEVCHWADGYHLNVRIYEKMLLSVFDILDEGKLTEEVEEILELLRATWRILGITETIHDTCYSWVLFRQVRSKLLSQKL